MTDDALLEQARRLWTTLAATPVTFTSSAVEVAVSAKSSLCPTGWVGIVVVADQRRSRARDLCLLRQGPLPAE